MALLPSLAADVKVNWEGLKSGDVAVQKASLLDSRSTGFLEDRDPPTAPVRTTWAKQGLPFRARCESGPLTALAQSDPDGLRKRRKATRPGRRPQHASRTILYLKPSVNELLLEYAGTLLIPYDDH